MLGRPCARCTTSAASNPPKLRPYQKVSRHRKSVSSAALRARDLSVNHLFSLPKESIQHTDAKAFPQFNGVNFGRRKNDRKDGTQNELVYFFRRRRARHLTRGYPDQRGQ